MKGYVNIYDDKRDEVIYDYEIDIDLSKLWGLFSDDEDGLYTFNECPFDGQRVLFNIVCDGEIDRKLWRLIKDLYRFDKEFVNDKSDLIDKYNNLVKNYSDYPLETVPAGRCIHFNPTKYGIEPDDDINIVELGIVFIDVNDLFIELLKRDVKELKKDIIYYLGSEKLDEDEYKFIVKLVKGLNKYNKLKRFNLL